MYAHSRLTNLTIPEGKFYLADAGFGICDSLLVPYCGIHYHLAEWGHANLQSVLHIYCVLYFYTAQFQASKL